MTGPMSSSLKNEYVFWILGLDLAIGLAYCLNCAGYYPFAAGLTVLCACAGPWGTLLIDPTILRGDFVPLAYTMLSVLLSSILLAPLATTILAVIQIIVLALIPLFGPIKDSIDWPNFLGLVLCTSVLSILSNSGRQRYVNLIERQAIQMAQSEAQLRELSIRNHLIQLFNRRYLEEVLDFEIQRSMQSHYSIGVIIFDLDNFKSINDKWGHAAGDAILRQLARWVLSNIRRGDIACRLGGDEWVLILPEATRDVT